MKTSAHIRYKNSEGNIVPGVTTVLSILNKPALVKWANNLGLQGIDSSKYRDKMADIGTLAHYLILCHLKKEKPDTSEYSPENIDKAENCLLSYLEWTKGHKIEPIIVEKPLVSEKFGYGGTVDCYCKMNGDFCLIDFKTGKGIYEEYIYHLAAYKQLLIDSGYQVDNVRILRIGRTENEGFEEKVVKDTEKEWEIFFHCLGIYELKKR